MGTWEIKQNQLLDLGQKQGLKRFEIQREKNLEPEEGDDAYGRGGDCRKEVSVFQILLIFLLHSIFFFVQLSILCCRFLKGALY